MAEENPYAPPESYVLEQSTREGVFRKNNQLVVSSDFKSPPICVKTGVDLTIQGNDTPVMMSVRRNGTQINPLQIILLVVHIGVIFLFKLISGSISPLYVIFSLPAYLFAHHFTKSKINLYLHLCDDEKKRRLSIRKRCLWSIAFPVVMFLLIMVNLPISNVTVAIAVIPLMIVYLVFIWLYYLTSQPLAFMYSKSGQYYLYGAHSDFLENYPELS